MTYTQNRSTEKSKVTEKSNGKVRTVSRKIGL